MRHLFLLLAILLFGAGLRIAGAARDHRFHADEAYFTAFARDAALNGDWGLHGELDKPPLSLYANALSITLFAARTNAAGVLDFNYAQGEFAARLANVFAGTIFIALMYSLGRYLYADPTLALWAALFAASAPLLIGFSASAFTDMLMLCLATVGLRLAVSGRWAWGGFWLALAFAAKPQALYLAPLIVTLGAAMRPLHWRDLTALLVPLPIAFVLISLWDASRGQPVSLWTLAAAHNTPTGIRFDGLVARIGEWLSYARAFIGASAPIFAIAIPLALLFSWRSRTRRATRISQILAAFVVGYSALHLLLDMPLYDRYLVPLAPAVCLLAAWGGIWLYRAIARLLTVPEVRIAGAAVAFALVTSGFDAAGGGGIGYDSPTTSFPDNSGIEQVADYLNSRHVAAVVYDHWLNWLLRYYLGEWSSVRRAYYPTPDALVADALALDEREPRYFPLPAGIPTGEWVAALEESGFAPHIAFRAGAFIVYELTPP